MARRPVLDDDLTPEFPVLRCSIDRNGAFKMDGDGGGSLTLSYDESQVEILTQLQLGYRMQELLVTFMKAPQS